MAVKNLDAILERAKDECSPTWFRKQIKLLVEETRRLYDGLPKSCSECSHGMLTTRCHHPALGKSRSIKGEKYHTSRAAFCPYEKELVVESKG